jgi:hypothetical protein
MRRFSRKTAVAAVAAVVLAVGGGVAFAYWSTTGSGTGSATNASSNGVVVLHAAFENGLTPGASETVTYTADNAGTSSLHIGTITPTVSIDAGHSDCLATDFSIAPTLSDTTVAAGTSGVAAGTGTLAFADTAVNQDGCKGAVVTLTLASN